MSEHQLLIGACGWDHPGWRGTFYPEDLPDDWQLGYYSNEYRVILVPAEYWRHNELAADLLDDSESNLRFILECSFLESARPRGEPAGCIQQAEKLGPRCAGILYRVDANTISDRSTLQENLLQCSADIPTCVEFTDTPDATLLQWCQQHQLGVCWHGDGQPRAAGSLNVARIREPTLSPKGLRQVIETCLGWGNGSGVTALLFDGDPPSIQLMENAGVILDLL